VKVMTSVPVQETPSSPPLGNTKARKATKSTKTTAKKAGKTKAKSKAKGRSKRSKIIIKEEEEVDQQEDEAPVDFISERKVGIVAHDAIPLGLKIDETISQRYLLLCSCRYDKQDFLGAMDAAAKVCFTPHLFVIIAKSWLLLGGSVSPRCILLQTRRRNQETTLRKGDILLCHWQVQSTEDQFRQP